MRHIVLLSLCVLMLVACGKKPNYVEAPEETKKQTQPEGTFPRGYPKPWL